MPERHTSTYIFCVQSHPSFKYEIPASLKTHFPQTPDLLLGRAQVSLRTFFRTKGNVAEKSTNVLIKTNRNNKTISKTDSFGFRIDRAYNKISITLYPFQQ